VQVSYKANSGRFLLLSLECNNCCASHYPVIPGASPATIGYQKEQYVQPIGNMECEWRFCETNWVAKKREMDLGKRLEKLEAFYKKLNWYAFSVESFRACRAHEKMNEEF
jgi:hypothetical protein